MASSMYSAKISSAEIAESCVTMDNGQHNDNGVLACARIAMPGALLSSDDEDAAANLNQCVPTNGPTPCMIFGHGTDGMIATGGGQEPTMDQLISLMNDTYWRPMLAPLKGRISTLTLMGCQVGANQDGSELLSVLADDLKCSVTAPVGLVYCNQGNIWVEGDQWMTVNPGLHPIPPGPIGHDIALSRRPTKIRLGRGVNRREYPLEAVDSVSIFRRKMIGGGAGATLDKSTALDLLRLVDFKRALHIKGTVSALLTGTIQIRIDTEQFGFRVLNDRLLQDENDSQIYYRASHAFERAFLSLI